MNLRERLVRFKTMRGHGVHSPFAFSLITGVLRPPGRGYGWYPGVEPQGDRWLSLIFRLACEFAPATARGLTSPELRAVRSAVGAVAEPVSGAAPDFEICGEPPREIVSPVTVIREIAPAGSTASFDTLCATLRRRMVFRGPRAAVIVTRPDFPEMDWLVNI